MSLPSPEAMLSQARIGVLLALCLSASGCASDTILGFAIGDISGLWRATSYEYRSNADPGLRVDLVARDGAMMTLSVSNAQSPPLASSTFDDGRGGGASGGGAVNVRDGTLTIGTTVYQVDHDGDRITLTDSSAMFDFGSGIVPATLVIRLTRI